MQWLVKDFPFKPHLGDICAVLVCEKNDFFFSVIKFKDFAWPNNNSCKQSN